MINFITRKDVKFSFDKDGRIVVDMNSIINTLSREGIDRAYAERLLKDLENKIELHDLDTAVEIQDKIIQFLSSVNEVAVPIIRYHKITESTMPQYIDIPSLLKLDDMLLIRQIPSKGEQKESVVFQLDLMHIFEQLEKSKISFSPTEREAITQSINDFMDHCNELNKQVYFDNMRTYNDYKEHIRTAALEVVNTALVSFYESIIYNHLMNDRGNPLYFSYTKEDGIIYDPKRVTNLTRVIGFGYTVEDVEHVTECIDHLLDVVNEDMADVIDSLDDDSLNALPLTVNSIIVNSLVYAKNSEASLEEIHEYMVSESSVDMGHIDMLYMYACADMLNKDHVIKVMKSHYKGVDYDIEDSAENILQEMKDTYKVVEGKPHDIIYLTMTNIFDKLIEDYVDNWLSNVPHMVSRQAHANSGIITLKNSQFEASTFTNAIKTFTDKKNILLD